MVYLAATVSYWLRVLTLRLRAEKMFMRTRTFDFAGDGGQRLSGRLDLPSGPVTSYAIFAHCFTCNKNSIAAVRIARALTARGFGVLRFDFTGLG